ncbi:MAG: hypothetical protein ACREUG_06840 [Steroidobacteraceae bacterium]
MTKSAAPFSLDNAHALLRKISINVLDQNADATLFTLPLEGIPLSREQLNAYVGPYTFESWFNQDAKTKLWSPMPWVGRLPKGEIALEDEFESDGAEIIVSGNKTLVFEADEETDAEEDGEPSAPVRVTAIRLKPQVGGITLMSLHLQVRPGLGTKNLALQEHQYRTVSVTLGNTALIERKGKQQALNFGEEGAAPANGNGEGGISEQPDGELGEFEAAARKQLEAATAQPGQVVDGRSERVKHQDRKRGRPAPAAH